MTLRTRLLPPIIACLTVAALPLASCSDRDGPAQPSRAIARQTGDLFDTLAMMELRAHPEIIAQAGLPGGLIGPQENAVLGERSQAAFERHRLRRIEVLKLLEEMPLAPDDSALRRDQETVLRTYDNAVRIAEFGHGRIGLGDAYPYVIDYRSGGWIELPDLLITRQSVSSRLDASDYVSRMVGMADRIDEERLRLIADAAAGVTPPEFILVALQARLIEMQRVPVADDPVITAFENRLNGIDDINSAQALALREQAVTALHDKVRPAYGALQAAVERLIEQSSDIPGVWALPNGDAYYDAALAVHVRPGATAEAMHREGRAQVAGIDARLDGALVEFGMVDGTVGERLAALAADPDQIYEDTPEGRTILLSDVAYDIQAAQSGMAAWIARQPEASVVADAMPPGFAAATTRAVYRPPTADGSRPGVFYLDLANLNAWPRYTLPALVYHETVPGHHTQATFAMNYSGMPLIRQLIWHTGFGEGWATYAEDLALDAGLMEDDPEARIGLLQSQLFSAARTVADTGIHRMRWSREEAIDYLVETTGLPREAMGNEVNRLAVWPGQATAYVAGAQQIEALRERARAVIGRDFDIAAFHYTLLAGGPRPLAQVELDMERWYEAQIGDR